MNRLCDMLENTCVVLWSKDRTVEQWKRVIWIDECSMERGKGRQQEWVFRELHGKWLPENITETVEAAHQNE